MALRLWHNVTILFSAKTQTHQGRQADPDPIEKMATEGSSAVRAPKQSRAAAPTAPHQGGDLFRVTGRGPAAVVPRTHSCNGLHTGG
jgi:hypothetical protein